MIPQTGHSGDVMVNQRTASSSSKGMWWIIAALSGSSAAATIAVGIIAKAADVHGTTLWWLVGAVATLVCIAAMAKELYDRSRPSVAPGPAEPLGSPPHNLPVLATHFTGRSREGSLLADRLRLPARGRRKRRGAPAVRAGVCVLYGESGVGKTQLALHYARARLDEHRITWWLNATHPDTLRTELLDLAAHLNIPDHVSKNVVLTKLWNWLRANPGWLLVYDGAGPDDPVVREQLALLREGAGEVLITTREGDGWGTFCTAPLQLLSLSPTDGLTFLQKRMRTTDGEDSAELTALGERLRWLPLALEQAAAQITNTDITLQEYLDGLPEEADVEDTFRLAIDQISQTSPASVDLLRLGAFLASEGVPRVALLNNRDVVPERLQSVLKDPAAFHSRVLLLVGHSLLTRTDEGRVGYAAYGMHPRVQELIRDLLSVRERLEWSQTAVRLVERWFPKTPDQFESRAECEKFMPHAEVVISKLVTDDEKNGILSAPREPEALLELLHRVGLYQETRCEWERALQLFKREADLCESGPRDELRRATAQLAQARQYYLLAKLTKAEKEGKEALALCLEHDGVPAFLPLQAQCQRQLGGIMRERNNFEGARRAVTAALDIYRRLGAEWDTLDRAMAEQELGMIDRNAGRLSRAESHYKRALTLVPSRGSRKPGEYVIFEAMIQRDLGIVAQDRGELETAHTELTGALDVFREYRGPEDFETALVAKFLADVKRRMGDEAYESARRSRQPMRRWQLRRENKNALAAADALLQPVLEVHLKRKQSEEHKYAACLNKVGSLRFSQGRLDEAQKTLREAEKIYIEKYGRRHHYRAKSLARLGPVLRAAGQRDAAEEVLREAEDIFKEALGNDNHPVLMAVYGHLADCAEDRGNKREAAALREAAKRIRGSLYLM
ncbi:tetratricopeptide repeat protein [Streptomyces hokutonensis]|uniref:tetratricopeptide repeat protein n=1 Tax=Streptomyces hokutonensis TaxID=1306990 RepID=UPI0038160187